jgi:hypothetical protein
MIFVGTGQTAKNPLWPRCLQWESFAIRADRARWSWGRRQNQTTFIPNPSRHRCATAGTPTSIKIESGSGWTARCRSPDSEAWSEFQRFTAGSPESHRNPKKGGLNNFRNGYTTSLCQPSPRSRVPQPGWILAMGGERLEPTFACRIQIRKSFPDAESLARFRCTRVLED